MHLTEEQLNEYLDNESTQRAQIEAHLSSCDECTARLTALQALFDEIESLPELELTHSLTSRFNPTPNPIPQLPRWLTLTAILQAGLAVVAIVLAAPFATQWLEPYLQMVTVQPLTDMLLDLQLSFTAWLQFFQAITLPEIPSNLFALPTEFTSGVLLVSVIGMFLAWGFGNWWLLRRKKDSLI